MGRGRAKAKQTKVARELKYSSGGTDLDRLRAELAGEPAGPTSAAIDENGDEDDEDELARGEFRRDLGDDDFRDRERPGELDDGDYASSR